MEMENATDPLALFDQWFADAVRNEVNDPNAMSLATATPDGVPSVRTVLLKSHYTGGFVFFTNLTSRKARELHANPRAMLCFHWKSLRRQVFVEGDVASVTEEEADAYYASRPRVSRIGAWASDQSKPLESRAQFEQRVAAFDEKFPGDAIPRPPYWSGFRVAPTRFEFWHDRPFRLHDRIEFRLLDGEWTRGRLYP